MAYLFPPHPQSHHQPTSFILHPSAYTAYDGGTMVRQQPGPKWRRLGSQQAGKSTVITKDRGSLGQSCKASGEGVWAELGGTQSPKRYWRQKEEHVQRLTLKHSVPLWRLQPDAKAHPKTRCPNTVFTAWCRRQTP